MTIMTTNAERKGPGLEVFPALPEQQPILANLLELYIHDFRSTGMSRTVTRCWSGWMEDSSWRLFSFAA
jgi:hypothetical protein